MMILLDTGEHYLVTDTRAEMVVVLLAHLAPGAVDLAALAAEAWGIGGGCGDRGKVVVRPA